MDELWQRYGAFWTPVLFGLGLFLVGLIVVNAVATDPEAAMKRVDAEARQVKDRIMPAEADRRALEQNADVLGQRLSDWARRLDQARLGDPVETVVGDALAAALLRGLEAPVLRSALAAPESAQGKAALVVFDGDAVAAAEALAKFEDTRRDRLDLLQKGDPNVGFFRLLSDVWTELRVRANRADVEIKADLLGFAGVSSVSRPVLAQRLLNLALVARIADLAIRSGVTAVQDVRLDQRQVPMGEDLFLRQFPVTVTLRGDMDSLRPVLDLLTDPARPVPLTSLLLTQPPRTSPEEGQVQLQFTAESVVVRPEASLALEMEER